MATWTAGAGSRATLAQDVTINWQNASANQSSLHVYTYINVSTTTGIYGTGSWNVQTAGVNRSNGFSYNPWPGPASYGLDTYDITVTHDVNGNYTSSVYAYVYSGNSPYFTSATINTSWGLPRLPLAPSLAAMTADTIKSTSARLGAEINNYGHGTSATFEMYYRLQGTGTWISLGQQGDVGGYNYWYPTGLTPGKTYEYYAACWNNNSGQGGSDSASFGVQTFKTQAVSGMISVIQRIT